jgi:hypothetical protein
MPQVIDFLWSAHIRTLARGTDILAARAQAPNSRDLVFASPGRAAGCRAGKPRICTGNEAGTGRTGAGIRFIIYLVNAKQVIRVLNHILGAYRQ